MLWELGGALGDLGTLLPLSVALISLNHMDPTGVFLVVGLTYVLAGIVYRLPVPVQPLKAVAAIAIATGLPAGVVSASGLLMAAFLLLVAVTGIVRPMARLFPKAIVRGIQLGLAMLLIKAGLSLVAKRPVIAGGDDALVSIANVSVPVGWLMAIAASVVFFLFLRRRWVPASLVLLGMGAIAGLFWGSVPGLTTLRMGLSFPAFSVPGIPDLSAAMVLLVIPQIPLTLGNAVFASADAARTYYGPKARGVTHRNLLTTMGIGNALAGILGGAPVCHGSGGFTAHHRLGARTGAAPLMIGGMLIALAIFVDGNVLPILAMIPYAVLGVLVVFVGVQHGLLVRDLSSRPEIAVAVLVAVVALATANMAVGFGSGMVLFGGFRLLWKTRGRSPAPPTSGLGHNSVRQV